MQQIENIAQQFFGEEEYSYSALGAGQINRTYLLSGSRKLVVQEISADVFPVPEQVVANFSTIRPYLLAADGYRWPLPETTIDGAPYFRDRDGAIWRAQEYIESPVIQYPGDKHAQEMGRALAHFHGYMQECEYGLLPHTLPGFHDFFAYLEQYQQQVAKSCEELQLARDLASYQQIAARFPRAMKNGELVCQYIHGDPKFDNFLFGKEGEVVSIIDLDTVFWSSPLIDIADAMRSLLGYANGWQLLRDFVEGYQSVREVEWEYVFDALLSISYELTIRFFTDHLQGDHYFVVNTPGENLKRAQGQCRLVAEIYAQEQYIRSIARF